MLRRFSGLLYTPRPNIPNGSGIIVPRLSCGNLAVAQSGNRVHFTADDLVAYRELLDQACLEKELMYSSDSLLMHPMTLMI